MSSDPSTPAEFDALASVAKEVATAMARIASDVALVIDHDGVIRDVAEGAASLPADCRRWVGQRWVDTVSTDTRRKIELVLDELRTAGVSQRREVNHPIAEGDAVPMAWTAIRLGENGPMVAVGRDLRAVAAIQRRFLDAQHEMELDYWQRRHADNRYRTLFQVVRDAVLVVDAYSFDVIEANDAARDLFGVASFDARPLVACAPDSARAPLAELLTTARSSGRAGEIRLRVGAAGSTWDVSATPFCVAEHQQLLVRARDHELTEDAQTPPAMMRALVESTPDAVVITDSAGHILLANPAFTALVQQGNEARVKGQNLTDVLGDRDGAWRATIERTRLRGLCPRTPLSVAHGQLSIAVEVSSTLLAEGDQEHLGFTLRTVEPPRAQPGTPLPDTWLELDALRAQVGVTPLETLMREAGQVFERRLIQTALNLASNQLDAAARLLATDPQALQLRMHRLDLGTHGGDETLAPSPPRRLN